jgi:hypothetical protein
MGERRLQLVEQVFGRGGEFRNHLSLSWSVLMATLSLSPEMNVFRRW